MISPNFEKIQKYLEKYFDQMIVEDLRLIKKEKHNFRFSYPYILLSCTGIDFLGGLEHGFNNNSSVRFQWFVREWMGKINPLYKEESLAYLIYDTWRSGISHQAGLKKGFESSSHMYSKDKHLHYIVDNNRIYIHALQFADDFIEAQQLYIENINDKALDAQYIDSLWTNLSNMINGTNTKRDIYFEELRSLLRLKNLVFSASSTTQTSSSTSTSSNTSPSGKDTITSLPNDDYFSTVSAAPDESDLDPK